MNGTDLAHLRAKLKRAQLIAALGIAAALLGGVCAAPLAVWVHGRARGAWAVVFGWLVARLWILIALPLLMGLASRVVALAPWPAAVGAALAGECCYLALDLVTVGAASLVENRVALLVRVATLAAGVALARRATLWGLATRRPRSAPSG